MAMKTEIFEQIIDIIDAHVDLSKYCLSKLKKSFPSVAEETLRSIISIQYQLRMKRNHYKLTMKAGKMVDEYKSAVLKGDAPVGVLMRIAVRHNVVLTSVARVLLDHYCREVFHMPDVQVKSTVSKMITDTSLIPDMRLAYEIYLCVVNDDQSGPFTEAIRHSIGLEYEAKLQQILSQKDIVFHDEEYLRNNGYDKTPDIKLDIPVAVDGFIINWVESKAMFGHPTSHNSYVNKQYLSYWNRFGPGLVIYWFGYLETIITPNEKRFIVRDNVPDNITHWTPASVEISSIKS